MKYNVKVVRSLRKSLSLSVTPDNIITVRCPRQLSENAINSFIERKKGWLEKVIADNETKILANKAVLEYREIYVCGQKLPLLVSDKNIVTQDAVYIKSIGDIKKTFISKFSKDFIAQAYNISDWLGISACGFSIRTYKRRWGCCDSKGRISFNYLLFMLPPELQRYVIIHELCHIVYFNHSPDFWRLVSKFEPEYKILKKQLKRFDFIINLY